MRRFVGVLLAACLAAASFAQGTFTIRRPLDGSIVRESVQIRIPKGGVPEGGYIGIVLNGKFLEAAMPPLVGNDYIYTLDTKARQIPDGPLSIEVLLYVDFQDKPQIANRSSINVRVDNSSSIPVSDRGLSLRYNFRPGQQLIYRLEQRQLVSQASQAQAQLGSRASELPVQAEEFRLMYAVDNTYGGDALLRLQGLPEKGKDYAFVTQLGQTAPSLIYAQDMQPLFMRVTNTGREVFSSAPPFFPLEGGGGSASPLEALALSPLPVLPERPVRPGDTWQGTFLLPTFDPVDNLNQERFTIGVPARGSFLGVEWQDGVPCAKLKYEVAVGEDELLKMPNVNQIQGEAVKIEMEQTVWFALDRRVIIRKEVSLVQETTVETGNAGAGVFGGRGPGGAPGSFPGGFPGGIPGMPPSMGGGARGGRPGAGGRAGAGGVMDERSLADDLGLRSLQFDPHTDSNGNLMFFRNRQMAPSIGMAPGPQGAPGMSPFQTGRPGQFPGFGGFRGATGGGVEKETLRVVSRTTFRLER